MRSKLSKILVTGGASFIGSEFVRQMVVRGHKVAVIDKLTYAGDLKRLEEVKEKILFRKLDICDAGKVAAVFKSVKADAVVNFAAETHVDRSILDATAFTRTNVIGTQVLLDLSRKYGISRFIHVSTDEVYGDIKKGKFKEDFPLKPNSPYAATKAAGDLLIKSYVRTYGFPAIIARPSNNYGPWQYPEKLIPVVLYKGLHNQNVPVYARGLNVREWLYVSDCADAVAFILSRGVCGEVYNVGSGFEKTNITTVRSILRLLNKPSKLIQYVQDRPGHDFRYALDSSKLRRLGWRAKVDFDSGLRKTVEWYCRNQPWLESKVAFLSGYWKKVYK